MSNRFDLEQQIMACWSVVEDIDLVYEAHGDVDKELANVLLGLKTLYQLKFEKLFHIFESCVKKKELRDDDHWTDIIRDKV